MTYFSIFGNKIFWEFETKNIALKNIKYFWNVCVFDLEENIEPSILSKLSQSIKYWIVIKYDQIWSYMTNLSDKIFWISDKNMWVQIKKEFGAKRFKIVEKNHTDLDIQKWIEIICMSKAENLRWIVTNYQNISFFESVDFGKPVRWMQVGMMSAKLTQFILNLWVFGLSKKISDTITVWDPFCGFGTTGFIANYFGHSFIWSDINISSIKENIKWRKNNNFYKENFFTIFKQDITKSVNNPTLDKVNTIVTEGRLWPIISHKTSILHLESNYKKIIDLYFSFLSNISSFKKIKTVVFTIPYYTKLWFSISQKIIDYSFKLWFLWEKIPEIYKRAWQQIAREVIFLYKS